MGGTNRRRITKMSILYAIISARIKCALFVYPKEVFHSTDIFIFT